MHDVALLRALALAAALALASSADAAAKAPVAATSDGPVRGILSGAIDRYLGIPYAAPPVGALRWRPPQPHGRWTGVRDAQTFAPHCAQGASPFGVGSASEDCLYLNVYTPARGGSEEEDDELLPVMVWIHGGALLVGESDDYDPIRLVRQGVVVVTLNYRLGVFGLLAHPALSAESGGHGSGNYGLMDQQAALRWVQRNIAAFGGDPGRVTIFGESAGGFSVHAHLASPASAGLFHGAIVESGAYSLTQPSLASAEALGSTVATRVGCSDESLTCLRNAPAAALLAAYQVSTGLFNVDGNVLPQSVGAAFASGQFNRVPVVEGSNHDEWRLFVALQIDLVTGPLAPARYIGAVAATLGVPPATAAFLASFYPLASYPSADLALSALGTDAVFACNARKATRLLSQYVPTHEYEFADENAPQDFLPPVSFPYASAHASEIQYLFDLPVTVPRPPLTADQQKLSDAMVSYWTNLAKLGSPNFFGTPLWPAYDTSSDTVQRLAPPSPSPSAGFAADHKCAIWTP